MKGQIVSVNISDAKGESKTPVQGRVSLKPGWGIVGDVHAGTPDRDVTLLPCEALGGVPFGGYGENIDTAGIGILDLPKGTVLTIGQTGGDPLVRATSGSGSGGEQVRIQITQHGKICPSRCSIYYKLGNCIMQEKGVFAKVLEGGEIMAGDEITIETTPTSGQTVAEGGPLASDPLVRATSGSGAADDDIAWILENCKRIALFGASPKAERPSHRIMRFLLEKGYEVIPIRSGVKEILNQRCYPSVREVAGDIDLVLIFRRSKEVPPIVEEAMGRGVKAVWMQEGIISPEAFAQATQGGLRAVMDRCIYKELMARGG
jgi:predicted CoA-binding protein/MOSC domain-containing protein YiiM